MDLAALAYGERSLRPVGAYKFTAILTAVTGKAPSASIIGKTLSAFPIPSGAMTWA